jgi:hypothetical protein
MFTKTSRMDVGLFKNIGRAQIASRQGIKLIE